eukprot:6207826-Pleurochrysis_carterae.AAC.1
MANIAKSSASAAAAESPSLPLRTPCSTARAVSMWSSVTPSLFCSADASLRLFLSISADSGPRHTPYVVSDSLCVFPLSLLPRFFAPSVATAK